MPRINFKATEQEFFRHPNDTYLVRVEEVKFTKAQSSNNNMLEVVYNTIAPGHEADGKKLFDRFVLVPQAGWRLKNFLEAFQVPHTAIPGAAKGEFEIDFDSDDIMNTHGIVETEQELYTVFEKGTKIPVQEADPDNPGKMRNKTGTRVNVKKYSQYTPPVGTTA